MNSPEAKKKLGEKLKNARIKAKMTQIQVAEKAGLNANYYATVERGEENISSENIMKLEEVLSVKILNI